MNPNGVKSPAAYVLFYRRRGAEAQDGDIEKVIESAKENGIRDDGAAGSLPDVDLFTGGFNGSASGGQLTPRRMSSQLPVLEQVTEERDEEATVAGVTGAALGLDYSLDDDDDDLPPPLLADDGADVGMDIGEVAGSSYQQLQQSSVAGHALTDLDDDVNMDDI
jgi:hypothetical protein